MSCILRTPQSLRPMNAYDYNNSIHTHVYECVSVHYSILMSVYEQFIHTHENGFVWKVQSNSYALTLSLSLTLSRGRHFNFFLRAKIFFLF